MRINNLKINGFGKIEDKEIELKNNINLIYGENESGKSTIINFIEGMFYGISKNKNKKEFSNFEKYKPWGEKEFSGKITYTLDNNEKYEIFRDFNKKNPKIYKEGIEISKEFNIDKNKGSEFFIEHTGIDEEVFLSTTLIQQNEVVLEQSEQNILTQKITNILSTGEENISYKKTNDKLSKKLVEEVGTDRTVGRPINVVNEKIEKLNKEKQNIQVNTEQEKNLQNSKQKLKNKLEELQIKINLIKEISKNKNEENLQKEKIGINNEILKEEKNKIIDIEDKIQENLSNKENEKTINIIIIIATILINIILFLFLKNKIITIASILIATIMIIFNIFRIIQKNKKIIEKQKNKKANLAEIKGIKNNIEKIKENINKINKEINEKNNIEKNIIKNKYKDKIDEEEIENLFKEDMEEINSILEDLNNDVSSTRMQNYKTEIEFNSITQQLEEKARIEEQLQNNIEQKEELLNLEKCINIAKTSLEKAYSKMKSEITPKFTKNLSNNINEISNGKYNNIKFIDGQGLIVELENGEYVNANRLSIGTIDQLYFSLRLSAIQEIAKENMPIILDESFAFYDDLRLSNILRYFSKEFKQNQIIIFTCSKREKEILEKNGIEYNYIELGSK